MTIERANETQACDKHRVARKKLRGGAGQRMYDTHAKVARPSRLNGSGPRVETKPIKGTARTATQARRPKDPSKPNDPSAAGPNPVPTCRNGSGSIEPVKPTASTSRTVNRAGRASALTTPRHVTPAPSIAATEQNNGSEAIARTKPTVCAPRSARKGRATARAITTPAPPVPSDSRLLVALVRLWDDQQRQRIRLGNLIGAIERAGSGIPGELQMNFARLTENENAVHKLVIQQWRTHPLAPWAHSVRGLGEHCAAIVVALLDGDPYVAHPKRWVENKDNSESEPSAAMWATQPKTPTLPEDSNGSMGTASLLTMHNGQAPSPLLADQNCGPTVEASPDAHWKHAPAIDEGAPAKSVPDAALRAPRRTLVCDPPYIRMPSQLWAYCGVGAPGRRVREMKQEDLFKLGKPLLKSRVFMIAASLLQAEHPTYRAVYDLARANVIERTHATPCDQCRGKRGPAARGAVGSPWRPGHQHTYALRLVGKRFLLDLWLESKRLHEAGLLGENVERNDIQRGGVQLSCETQWRDDPLEHSDGAAHAVHETHTSSGPPEHSDETAHPPHDTRARSGRPAELSAHE